MPLAAANTPMTPHLTILFDNVPGPAGLTALWGFSALIDTGAQRILFDTGSNGRVLLKNMAALGIAPGQVDLVFLSHPHWDHMGGLDSVLEANPAVRVVLHEGFSKHLIADLHGLCREVTVVGREPLPLAPGVFSTGLLDSEPPEHGLLLDIGGSTAAVSGCAHPGMDRIVERGIAVLGGPVRWAVGGFHLMYADAEGIAGAIAGLRRLGVTDVVPTHCTGDAARAAFALAFGEHCVDGGAGRVIRLASNTGD